MHKNTTVKAAKVCAKCALLLYDSGVLHSDIIRAVYGIL